MQRRLREGFDVVAWEEKDEKRENKTKNERTMVLFPVLLQRVRFRFPVVVFTLYSLGPVQRSME